MYPEWMGIPVIPSKAAMEELARKHMTLGDVVDILETGYNCERSRRAKGVIERCTASGGKVTKVVVVKSFNYTLETDCWLLVHVGRFTG